MVLRVTRTQTEAAGAQTDGELRVTRLQTEAAGLTARPPIRAIRVQLQVLAARFATIPLTASNTIQLTQVVDVVNTGLTLSNTILISQGVSEPLPKILTAADTIQVSQVVTLSPKVINLAQTILLTHVATKDTIETTPSNSIQVSQTLAFQQLLAGGIVQNITQNIVVSGVVKIPTDLPVANTVLVSQILSFETILNPFNDILISQDLPVLNFVRTISLTQNITVSHLILLEKDEPDLCRYSPIIAGGAILGLPTPPSLTPPIVSRSKIVTLFWPVVSPTLTVVLRSPELGDRDRQQRDRIFRESRGGTLEVAIGSVVRQDVVSFVITAVKEIIGQQYLTFIEATLGLEIGMTDHENRSWRGFLVSTADPIIRNRPEVDISFEFIREAQL